MVTVLLRPCVSKTKTENGTRRKTAADLQNQLSCCKRAGEAGSDVCLLAVMDSKHVLKTCTQNMYSKRQPPMLVVVSTKEVFEDQATLTADEFRSTQDHDPPVFLHFDLVSSGTCRLLCLVQYTFYSVSLFCLILLDAAHNPMNCLSPQCPLCSTLGFRGAPRNEVRFKSKCV